MQFAWTTRASVITVANVVNYLKLLENLKRGLVRLKHRRGIKENYSRIERTVAKFIVAQKSPIGKELKGDFCNPQEEELSRQSSAE